MDDTDIRILRILQEDSSLSITEVARRVSLSASPCWKRINKLEAEGIICRQTAVLDAEKMGFGLTVFVEVRTGEHSGLWLRKFADLVANMPEVLEFHRLAGEVDYLLKVKVRDMKRIDEFYKRLIETMPLAEVTSRFSMEKINETTALPI
ncbi:MAG: transcriptional regulator [Rhodospirillaceae bacterium]|nr:transcriptional regulator [Rhodospirillaceae bacterium]